METLELMRDTKHIERSCFHTSVFPELISVVMYKNAGQAIILATMAMVNNAPIHRARVATEWFDEHENNVNHLPQSPDLNTYERLWSGA